MYYVEVRGDHEVGPKLFVKKSSANSYAIKLVKRFIGSSRDVQIIIADGNVLDRVITISE